MTSGTSSSGTSSLTGIDMLDQPGWAPDGGHGGGDTAARVNSDGSREIRVSIPENVGTRELLAILGRRGTNMAQVPERGVRDVRDSWGVEALFGGFDKPEQVHSRLVIPPKVRPIRVVTLESPLLNLKFPPSIDAGCAVQLRLRRRAQRRYQPTGTIVGRATIPRAARERPEDGLRSRPGARAVRAGQHRGPSWGRSELRRRRVTGQAGRGAGGAYERHPRSLHGRPPRRRGTSASERP